MAEPPSDLLRHLTRRQVLAALSAAGIGTAGWRRAVAQQVAESGAVTDEMLRAAEWVADLRLTDEQRAAARERIARQLQQLKELRAMPIPHEVPPAVQFRTLAHTTLDDPPARRATPRVRGAGPVPASDEDLAFLPVAQLAGLLRSRQISSLQLTELYLSRLKRFDPLLKCVVTYTDDLARQQARQADQEIAAGNYRGPLHGIPWGAKDLIAYPGYPTTWGATPYQQQTLATKATVAQRLEAAGAVLIAKLSLGALAMGDRWFGQQTRNPWNPAQGSSGSSAGSAAATAAGLVGFSLGSETLGSIISPARRCGCTGLRPTYGRVSRFGCMTLSWSMDKIGPLTRSVEDAALVLDAIHGADGRDVTAVTQPFDWPTQSPLNRLRVGYFADEQSQRQADLEILRELGVQLVPVELPSDYPTDAVALMLDVEAATVFDDLTRQQISQDLNAWPDIFRACEFVPAVEYLRANRIRTLLMQAIEAQVFAQVDLYVGGDDLALTNLTGHPSVVIPHGRVEPAAGQSPGSLKFTGRWFGEETLLAVADAFQRQRGDHLQRPPLNNSGTQAP
jgi:Asp-tRNA(Asn)/Glu-tRNA(Gln) amidotransferase A subunit family amidase